MPARRSRFAGGDQEYLRRVQYADSGRLADRANLHARYSTATTTWFDWVAGRYELRPSAAVLEAGCGAGWTWAETSVPIPPGIELTLTDLSSAMVDEAVPRAMATGRFAGVVGATADLQHLPFVARRFDRVVANHMLYHLPDPSLGVAELARVVRPDGIVIAATNGQRHMRELWAIAAEVVGPAGIDTPVDATIEVFGAVTGFAILRDHFGDVRWHRYEDELHCTDPDDVLAYVCSTPPGEDAPADQRARLREAIRAAFAAGDGVLRVEKDVGCFVCRRPLR